MSITITSGGFDGIIRSDTGGNNFIETANNTKSVRIGGLVEYTGSITRQLDKATGKTIRESERVLSTGKTFQRSGSATANQIEFQQTTVGAFISVSGSSGNTGYNLIEKDKLKLIRSTHNLHVSGGTTTTTAVNQVDNGGNWQYNVNSGLLKTRTAATQFTVSSSGDAFVKNNLIIGGNLTAEQYIVSSSVTNVTTLAQSGSTKFGDDQADTHEFTGSVKITGSMNFDGLAEINLTNVTASGNISASGDIYADGIKATLPAGVDNSVVILDADGFLKTDEVDSKIFDTDGLISPSGASTFGSSNNGKFPFIDDGDTNTLDGGSRLKNVTGGIEVTGHITASGNISSSGDMFSGQFIQLTNSQSVVDTFNTSSFQTCKYVLQVTSASNIQSSEMLVMQNSSNAFNTEYAQINSGLNLTNFSTKVNLSNVELISSSSFVSCSVKFVRTLI